jgi:branched-chain amino acid transport system ATP-binding protein
MLAVAVSLMGPSQAAMMDEPSLGLPPLLLSKHIGNHQGNQQGGVNVLLIEQNAKAALEISDYGYVMETGAIVISGTSKRSAGQRPWSARRTWESSSSIFCHRR